MGLSTVWGFQLAGGVMGETHINASTTIKPAEAASMAVWVFHCRWILIQPIR